MKKVFGVLLFFSVFATQVMANDDPYAIAVGSIEVNTINVLSRFEKSTLAVMTIVKEKDEHKGAIMLVTTDSIGSIYRLTLVDAKDKRTDETFRNALTKYLEWEAIARREAVEVEREITSLVALPEWKSVGTWYTGVRRSTIKLLIFSQNVTRHQLVLSASKVASKANQYIDFDMDKLYIDKDQVEALLKLLEPEHIAQKVREAKAEQARKDDLFK
ncbi:hypothetical protein [Entomospira culicis]|uniref:DUF4412 domain-containing protein n=1 Tax=Entomospira culicis TaxID=2719989 RepID=A0A968GF82_9SPIO|nr:hypothetical protein [Entomospira culicis]NIZ19589.1 hypothetical protein [Entomospira culicis]NIZ69506.1 hypothetical protein [Entomospira culicis]WDI36621.1 hypothetical protein PVA46_04660 [Entomospira culicis]WDI38249.1 hypothetical protein PVA47_04670 [Entomospira culicis]